jgi:hypothetical protein
MTNSLLCNIGVLTLKNQGITRQHFCLNLTLSIFMEIGQIIFRIWTVLTNILLFVLLLLQLLPWHYRCFRKMANEEISFIVTFFIPPHDCLTFHNSIDESVWRSVRKHRHNFMRISINGSWLIKTGHNSAVLSFI